MTPLRSKIPARIAGMVTFVIGAVVLIGWACHCDALKSIFPGLVTMKANTAFGLLLSGLALTLLAQERVGARLRLITSALGLVIGLLGALSLSEYFLGWNPGIDELLFRDAGSSVGTSRPGQMAPSTAFAFMLVACAILVASPRILPQLRISLLAALGAALFAVGGMACLGQISNGLFAFHLWNYFGMALHTAGGFALLGAGLVALARSEGKVGWALDKSITGGFLISMAILLTAAGVSWDYTHQLQETSLAVSRTHEILKDIEEIRADKALLESAQRGFVILGDERQLASRPALKAEVRQDLANLRRLTADDPQQQHWLDQLEPLMAQRTVFAEQIIAARRQQGFEAAQKILADGPGLALSAEIADVHRAMHDEAAALLVTRLKNADDASTATFLLLPLAVFLSLTLLSLALFFLNAGVGERAQVEEKLKESLKEIIDLQAALDEHALVSATDPRGKITYANDKFCAISGFTREELLGQDHRIINSAHHPKEFIQDLWTTIARGRVWHGEICNKAKDGSFYWVDTTIVPFLNDHGKPRQYIAIRTDITERKRAEEALRESELRFRTMVDAIPQLTWMAHPDGSIFWYNQRWFDYTGTTSEQMEGWGWQRVHDPEVLPKVTERWKKSIASGEPFEMEFPLRAADGHFGWFLTRVIPLKDDAGRVLRWFGTNTDLSQKREAEEQIKSLNTRLEQRVTERTSELEMANKELEAFSYSVSHDLRAPLRAVDGFSQAVVEDYGEQLPAQGLHYLKTVREGAQRMGMLIDDLLTFSRLSRASLAKRTVDPAEMVRDILKDMKADARDRQIEIRMERLPSCLGDPALLKQVWINLLSNAFKYSRQRQPAIIEIGCKVEGDENVYFVRDNGAGFDMRYADKLFGVFQRLHRADQFEGTGVGLAIVQRVVHRHGGRIWAEAALDRGATFYFTLKQEKETET